MSRPISEEFEDFDPEKEGLDGFIDRLKRSNKKRTTVEVPSTEELLKKIDDFWEKEA